MNSLKEAKYIWDRCNRAIWVRRLFLVWLQFSVLFLAGKTNKIYQENSINKIKNILDSNWAWQLKYCVFYGSTGHYNPEGADVNLKIAGGF